MMAVASLFLATRYLGISFYVKASLRRFGALRPFILIFSFSGLGSCLSTFICIAFTIINRLIPSLGPLAKWRSVFYWILASTLDLDWLCPDLVIIDLSRSVMPSSSNGEKNRFPNTFSSYWGFSSFFLSFFQGFNFLGTFTHQVLKTRMLSLSCK